MWEKAVQKLSCKESKMNIKDQQHSHIHEFYWLSVAFRTWQEEENVYICRFHAYIFTIWCSNCFDYFMRNSMVARCVPRRRGFRLGSRRKNLDGWFLKKNLPRGTVLEFGRRCRQQLVELRRGAGMCLDPCISGRVSDSAFTEVRVRMSCSNRLTHTRHHKFQHHASSPQTAATALTDL